MAKSPADGYSLLMATFAHAVNPAIHKKLPYDTDKAFAPVALIGKSPNVLVVSPKSRFKSVQDILAYARAHPGKLTFGSYGNGTSAHLAGEMFKSLGKVDILHVPYKGSGPGINDLIGGQIDMIFSTSASVSGHVKSGQLRALAVTTKERSPAYPGVPTVAEAGYPGYEAMVWFGMLAPAGLPEPVREKLTDGLVQTLHAPVMKTYLEQQGAQVSDVAGPAFGTMIKDEISKWCQVVKKADIHLD